MVTGAGRCTRLIGESETATSLLSSQALSFVWSKVAQEHS
jgi:hypothetical protein